MHPKLISIQDFTYHLPQEKIALYPAAQRHNAKLLIYKNGKIAQNNYNNIAQFLPQNSHLVFNDTKVINARIIFTKLTGGIIEIFLLEPYQADYTSTLTNTKSCKWKCFIGGASKWKEGKLNRQWAIDNEQWTISNGQLGTSPDSNTKQVNLNVVLCEKTVDAYIVEFDWDVEISFAEILEQVGNLPLPPYLNRNVEEEDKKNYQTIYAAHDGSVAAPTAGLHFTENIFKSFESKSISIQFVTLHVGAGTFKPVKAASMQAHEMHAEWIDVSIDAIENIIANLQNKIVAVGTTSLRTLESLYWLGVKAILNPAINQLQINQWEVYDDLQEAENISAEESLTALITWLQKNNLPNLFTQTQILIAPGYSFKIVNAIVTNFHQPQSTLLLLVAAAVGNDWKKIYDYAFKNEFRFLSYGDGSLLFLNDEK